MRHLSIRLSLVVVVAALVVSGSGVRGQGPARAAVERVNGHDAVAGEALVKLRGPRRADEMRQLGVRHDLDRSEPVGRLGIARVHSNSQTTADLLQRLAADPDVEYAEPNYIVHALAQPDDPQFPQLWGLLNTGQPINGIGGTPGADIHATDAWNVTVGSRDNVVAVIDTGVDYRHPDLAANIWSAPAAFTVTIGGVPITCPAGSHGFNAIARTCDPMDDNLHGTHVSGTIGAVGNNGRGVAGVNWTASIMGSKFLDASGSGSLADAIDAMDFVIQAKDAFRATLGANVRVLSNSWGGGDFSQAMLDEINAANAADMLFVAAAGNSGLPTDWFPAYPASYDAPNIIGVAATTNGDDLAWFSNYGATTVHLAAPGVDILSTTPNNGYAYESGTSMATPHVSGAAALVLSRCPMNTPDLKETLLATVETVPALAGTTITGGRLDVNSALHACMAPPDAPQLSALSGDHQAFLTWTGGAGAISFTVRRSLASGGPYTTLASGVKTRSYTDSSLTNGTTYYYVVTGTNTLGDSPASNEASATPRTPADLVVSAFTLPASGGAGASLAVTATIKNQGLGNADPSTARVYFSNDTEIDGGDALLATVAVPALSPGGSFSASMAGVVPPSAATGSHWVIARADDDNKVYESSETNNTSRRSIQIGPDLVVPAMSTPATAAPGTTISITDTVTNQGGASSVASTTRFYLSVNAGFDTSDVELTGARAVPALAAGATSTGTTLVALPPNIAAGSYYVFARADADNTIAESQESNNLAFKTVQIGGNLVISALNAPATAGPATAFLVTDTTANTGAGPVRASTTRFYLSANAIFDASDTLLGGAHGVPDLAAGASDTVSTWVTVPASVGTGSYYLIARADADSVVPETQESDNLKLRSIQIGADLTISSMTIPGKGGAGKPLTISETTTNRGAAPTPPTVTRFYLSSNLTVDAGDVELLPGRAVPALAAGESSTATTTVTVPAHAVGGTPYLLVQADGTNAVAEISETNNVAFRSIQIGPDLMISALSVPGKGGIGMTIDVADTVVNQGAGDAPASTVRYYLSPKAVLDATARLLDPGRPLPALVAGAASSGTVTLTIPADTPGGSYYLIAKADGDAVVSESQETNNTAPRSIGIGADLKVTGLSAATSAPAGGAISVTDSVTNQGIGPADPSTTRFYLSANVLLDGSDVPLFDARAVPSLDTNQSSSGVTTVVIPPGTAPGTYYLLAVTDGDNAVREALETNNVLARSIQVTAP